MYGCNAITLSSVDFVDLMYITSIIIINYYIRKIVFGHPGCDTYHLSSCDMCHLPNSFLFSQFLSLFLLEKTHTSYGSSPLTSCCQKIQALLKHPLWGATLNFYIFRQMTTTNYHVLSMVCFPQFFTKQIRPSYPDSESSDSVCLYYFNFHGKFCNII